jgi:hypothetical protein
MSDPVLVAPAVAGERLPPGGGAAVLAARLASYQSPAVC